MTEEEKKKQMEEARQLAWSAAALRRKDIQRLMTEGITEADHLLINCILALVLGEIAYRHIDTSEGM